MTQEMDAEQARRDRMKRREAITRTTGLLGMGAATISGDLAAFAREAYVRCIEARASGKVSVTEDNNYSDYALLVFVLSVAALEAFINETAFAPMFGITRLDRPLTRLLEPLDLPRKYYFVPRLLWGRTFDTGGPPYQDFALLVHLRNDVMHYKMKHLPRNYHRALHAKGLLLHDPDEPGVVWVHNVSNAKAALWAYNTACRVANAFLDLAPQDVRKGWDFMRDNFQEIPNDYWKELTADNAG